MTTSNINIQLKLESVQIDMFGEDQIIEHTKKETVDIGVDLPEHSGGATTMEALIHDICDALGIQVELDFGTRNHNITITRTLSGENPIGSNRFAIDLRRKVSYRAMQLWMVDYYSKNSECQIANAALDLYWSRLKRIGADEDLEVIEETFKNAVIPHCKMGRLLHNDRKRASGRIQAAIKKVEQARKEGIHLELKDVLEQQSAFSINPKLKPSHRTPVTDISALKSLFFSILGEDVSIANELHIDWRLVKTQEDVNELVNLVNDIQNAEDFSDDPEFLQENLKKAYSKSKSIVRKSESAASFAKVLRDSIMKAKTQNRPKVKAGKFVAYERDDEAVMLDPGFTVDELNQYGNNVL